MIIQTTNGPLEYFLRDSKKGKIKVLGKETDTYICNTCKKYFNQKNFHTAQCNNYDIRRLRTQCKFCYNTERHNRRYKVKLTIAYPEDNKCQNCKKIKKKLVLDHCHKTFSHRGWLCINCNAAYGSFGDNIEGLQNAINYLKGVKI